MYEIIQCIGIGILGTFIWIIFEFWRAPLLKENEDGSWSTIRPPKKINNPFKNFKKSSGSYSDLEKYRRGRSKH
jgi:hypothetical protein